MTKWEAPSDSDGSDLSVREVLRNLPDTHWECWGQGRCVAGSRWGEAVTGDITSFVGLWTVQSRYHLQSEFWGQEALLLTCQGAAPPCPRVPDSHPMRQRF